MALRLSSPYSSGIDGYMKQITDDTSISLAQKHDCLKTLAVVLKNLIDSSKGGVAGETGLKYRTLKLDNAKLKARLFCTSSSSNPNDDNCCVRDLLLDRSLVGMSMASTGTSLTLTMTDAPSPTIRDVIGLKVLPAISTAQRDIATKMETASGNGGSGSATKKAKLTEHNDNRRTTDAVVSSSASSFVPSNERLSEKQKARILMEEKERIEKEREKAYRKATRAKIAADKLVRQTDENWKPSVSAAADKTGTGLLSFRDRHGNE